MERKIHFIAFDLPHSDACFVVAYPAETTEAFCDGHVWAFAFFGGVPKSILYDNTKINASSLGSFPRGSGSLLDNPGQRVHRLRIEDAVRRGFTCHGNP